METFTLLILALAIALGFWRKINTGIISLGLAFLVGIFFMGLKAKEITSGFPTSLFITLFGITSLFSAARANGTLQTVVGKAANITGSNRKLIPVVFFVISFALAALGPGNPSTSAIMFPIALAFAESEGISDLLMIMMVGCGGVAGQQSPLASSGIVAKTLMSDIGLDNYTPAFLSVMLTAMIAAVLFYFFLKGHRLENKKIESKESIPLNSRQKITLFVIAVVLILIALFKYDVGLTAILGTGVLLLIGVADEKETLKNCPWGVYIMIGGVSLLVSLVNQAGGITKLSDYLASIMTPATAAPIMCLLGGLMSSVSSAVGVTMPTLIPTIPSIIERVGGNVSATVLASATIVGSLMVVFSPFSTLGGLAMASATAKTDKIKLFNQLIFIAIGVTLFAMLLAFIGFYALL